MRLKITDAPYFVKIPVRLKISVGLKISVRSENPYLKISVHPVGKPSGAVQVFRSPAKDCRQGEQERRNTRPPKESRRATNKEIFCLYIGIIAPNEKYLQKNVKKNLQVSKFVVPLQSETTNNTPKGKKKVQQLK